MVTVLISFFQKGLSQSYETVQRQKGLSHAMTQTSDRGVIWGYVPEGVKCGGWFIRGCACLGDRPRVLSPPNNAVREIGPFAFARFTVRANWGLSHEIGPFAFARFTVCANWGLSHEIGPFGFAHTVKRAKPKGPISIS